MFFSSKTKIFFFLNIRNMRFNQSSLVPPNPEKNKDHQRMMVDPMFMILQRLRLFLAAVTPTDVAAIAVISPVFS